MTSSANGLAYSLMNSHSPLATNSSSWRSASRHMNSSFSFSRFGVISRISSAAVRGVLRRVERRELVAERQLVAVLLDERR